jgi:hypothetical protein
VKTYLITTAVSETQVHAGFWAALEVYAEEHDAEILVVPQLYLNPTSKRSKRTRQSQERYAPEVNPYLIRKRTKLAPNLVLMADVPVQPTRGNPLASMEILARRTSAIVAHVTRQIVCVPTDRREPRVLWTTTACTLPKYSKTTAGARAKEHHAVGALVVEVDSDGLFFVRHISASSKTGGFYDLETYYSADGVEGSRCAAAVVLGDIHVGQEAPEVLRASRKLVESLAPEHLVLHDVLDMSSRSHHRQSMRDGWDGRGALVEDEVQRACEALSEFATWGAAEVHVVRSNHDEHLERFAEEFDPRKDPINAPYWHRLMSDAYAVREETGKWPDLFAMEACGRVEGCVSFLDREESLKVAGCELSLHGDKGINGARGSIRSFAKLGVKTVVGHSHTPGWYQGCVQVGVTGKLNMDYNHRPSSWAHAQCVVHPDGKRQLVFVNNGRYRGGQK